MKLKDVCISGKESTDGKLYRNLELAKIENKWWRVQEPTDASTVTTPQLQRTSQKRSRKMVKGQITPYIDDKNDMD